MRRPGSTRLFTYSQISSVHACGPDLFDRFAWSLCERYRTGAAPAREDFADALLVAAGSVTADADLAADAVLVAISSVESFTGGSLIEWVREIVRRLARTRRRKEARLRYEPLPANLVRPDPDVYVRAFARERGEGITRAIEKLPGRLRLVVELRIAGKSPSEIAAKLAMEVATVRGYLSRARETLRATTDIWAEAGR